MYSNVNWMQLLQQLHEHCHWQTIKIQQMEIDIQQLKDEVSALKQQRQITVEKIEYKFDLLKVEKLEGTLNIGVSPASGESIEDLVVNQENPGEANKSSSVTETLYSEAYRQTDLFLDEEGLMVFKGIETRYDYRLDAEHRHIVINDIKNQLSDRIRFYINQGEQSDLKHDQDAFLETIVAKVKRDIQLAIDAYLNKTAKKESDI
jgi:spore germination protein PC